MLSLLKKTRVLLLDDDPAMRRLVSTLLKRKGHRVEVVGNGLDAIKSLVRDEYDVILLDVMMPHEGGMTVVRHLREKKPAWLKRVILLTATPEGVLKTVEPEIFDVVRKPFEPEALTDSVARLVSGSK